MRAARQSSVASPGGGGSQHAGTRCVARRHRHLGDTPPRAGMRTYTRQPVRRPFDLLSQIVQTLVLTIVVYAAIQAFVTQPYRVVQGSMQDTLQEG